MTRTIKDMYVDKEIVSKPTKDIEQARKRNIERIVEVFFLLYYNAVKELLVDASKGLSDSVASG